MCQYKCTDKIPIKLCIDGNEQMAGKKTVTIDMGRAEQAMRDKYDDRERVTIYISRKLYDDFTELCLPTAASAGIQILMQEFVNAVSARGSSKRSK